MFGNLNLAIQFDRFVGLLVGQGAFPEITFGGLIFMVHGQDDHVKYANL